jgi:DNA-binding XRE family transcriptional regulator
MTYSSFKFQTTAISVTKQPVHALEKRKYNPSLELLFAIAHYFKPKIEEVFIYNKSLKKISWRQANIE